MYPPRLTCYPPSFAFFILLLIILSDITAPSFFLFLTSLNNGSANKRLKLHSLVSAFIIGKIHLFVNVVHRIIQGFSTLRTTFLSKLHKCNCKKFNNKHTSYKLLTNVNSYNQKVSSTLLFLNHLLAASCPKINAMLLNFRHKNAILNMQIFHLYILIFKADFIAR